MVRKRVGGYIPPLPASWGFEDVADGSWGGREFTDIGIGVLEAVR